MDNTPTIYTTPESLGSLTIRVMGTAEDLKFILTDVAKALGRGTPNAMTGSLAPDEKGLIAVYTPGGIQSLGFVTEAGLYRVLMRSTSPNARPFQDWVVREVLPSIRKHGIYLAGQEKVKTGEMSLADLGKVAAEAYKSLSEALAKEVEKLTTENAEMAPKALLVDTHVAPREFDTITKFVRTFAGVNSMAVKKDLARMNYLWRTAKGAYRVYAQHRDVLFVEKFDQVRGTYDVFPTAAGKAELASLYAGNRLTMKKLHAAVS